jgi:hypothetical protein
MVRIPVRLGSNRTAKASHKASTVLDILNEIFGNGLFAKQISS